MHTSIPLLLVWSADLIDQDIERLEQHDSPDEIRKLFQKIDFANKIIRAWVESTGGSIISLNGHRGSAEMPAEKVADLPKIRVQYSEAIEGPFSVGVGSKLSEAQKALEVIQKRGGDQVLLYTPDIEKDIQDETKEDPLAKSIKNAVIGGAMVAGMLAAPAYAPTNVPAPPKPAIVSSSVPSKWSAAGLDNDLFPIAHLESSFGKNVKHKTHSGDAFKTAVGALGIKPQTAHEEFLRNPGMQRRFPALFDRDKFLTAMNSDYGFYNQISSAYWDRLKTQLRSKLDRTAYAWRWGKTAALHAPPDVIKKDPYVQNYLRLKAKGIYKMENEDFDLDNLAKDEGIDEPKQEASEHSEGEVASHVFEEGMKKKPTDVTSHLHKLALAQHASDNAEQSQEDEDKELTQIKSGVVSILQHVQKLQPQFEELAQTAPEVYKTILEMVKGMITMAKEFDSSPINKSEDDEYIDLFHGTPANNLGSISADGLRPNESMMGNGVWFTNNQEHARDYGTVLRFRTHPSNVVKTNEGPDHNTVYYKYRMGNVQPSDLHIQNGSDWVPLDNLNKGEVIPFPGNPNPKHTYRKNATVQGIGTPDEIADVHREQHQRNLTEQIANEKVPDTVPKSPIVTGINGTHVYDYSHFLDPNLHPDYNIRIGYSPKKDGFTLAELLHRGNVVASSWTYPSVHAMYDYKAVNPPKISDPIHKPIVNGPLMQALSAHLHLGRRDRLQNVYDNAFGLDKAAIPESGTRQHLHLPVGSKIDGVGKLKIQNPDGTTSWISARSGQILSPLTSQTLAGSSPVPNHPLSARSSNAKPEKALENRPQFGTSTGV